MGTIHYKTIARYLVRDDDNAGRVSAVVATDPDGNYVKYVGRKAVVMATGDFSANQDMMAKYCDWVAPLLQYNEIDYDAVFQFGGLGSGEGKDPLSCEAYLAQWDSNVESGTFVKGGTLEEVIAQLDGLDAEAALASIDHYNELCDAGCDTDFHKDASLMAPIKEGPFYGCKLSMSPANFLCVTGGLNTNERWQVCDADDNPIEGLYNIGIMVGDSYGNCYNFAVCGHNLGMNCINAGYRLGKALAE